MQTVVIPGAGLGGGESRLNPVGGTAVFNML